VTKTGPGVYEGRAGRDWWIARGPNGGYLAAMLMRALIAAVGDDERLPRSLTIHYTAAPAEGAVHIATTIERAGRSLTTVTARMEQGERLIAIAIGAFSKARRDAVELSDARMPEATPLERTELFPKGEPFPPFASNWDMRPALGGLPFTGGEALAGGWIRPAEVQPWDYALIAQLTDAWFPAVFSRMNEPKGVPTVDLTIHFRAELPLPDLTPEDHVLVVFRSRLAVHGFVEEDGELWSRGGTLIAQSRQLALLQAPSHE
jgi:acyl-coenzyme A thioesterase PaaI-like protein